MDAGYQLEHENPLESANIFSKIFFSWMIGVCSKLTKQKIHLKDLYKLPPKLSTKILTDKFEAIWNNELIKCKKLNKLPSLKFVIFKATSRDLLIHSIPLIIHRIIIRPSISLILSYFLKEYTIEDEISYKLYLGATFLATVIMLDNIIYQHIDLDGSIVGMKVRIALTNLIYKKCLNLSSSYETSVGQIINLISNDVNRFDFVFKRIIYLVIFPFYVTIMGYLLWDEVQLFALAGIITPILISLLQYSLSRLLKKLRGKVASFTGKRIKLIHEVVCGIKIIKMYSWEKFFNKSISDIRNSEMKALKIFFYARPILGQCLYTVSERSSMFITVASYVYFNGDLNARKLFTLATLYSTYANYMNVQLSLGFLTWAETLTSIKRIEDFLLAEEHTVDIKYQYDNQDIIINNISAGYLKDNNVLNQIDLRIPQGSLCVIIGAVASAKSSLLRLLLGELRISSGTIKIHNDMSYASQNPWIFASTVRDNIIFGQDFDIEKYRKVVQVCALEHDLKMFSNGDQTVAGERGVVLSGGQRARINLARAVYRDAQIYLLDDPLSAVDANVGKHIFEECILKYLKNKTRILVTHQLQYLEQADMIVVLDNGKIRVKGSFQDISKTDSDILKFIKQSSNVSEDQVTKDSNLEYSKDNKKETQTRFSNEEINVESSSYFDYIKASGSNMKIALVCLLMIFTQSLYSSIDYWTTIWTRKQDIAHDEIIQLEPTNKSHINFIYNLSIPGLNECQFWILIYGILTLTTCIFLIIKQLVLARLLLDSSNNLHQKMLDSVLNTHSKFFDKNPSGRILNRFSKDMGLVDEFLPISVLISSELIVLAIGNIVIIAISNYLMILPIICMSLAFITLVRRYIKFNLIVKHLESVAHSPVFSYVNWTLNGLSTIRCFKNENIVSQEFENHQDLHSSAWLLTLTTKSAFTLWMQLVFVAQMIIVTFTSIIIKIFDLFNVNDVGLTISQSMALSNWLQISLYFIGDIANGLINVQRIVEYTKLENENQYSYNLKATIDAGRIEFKNVSLKYDQSYVLQNLNFSINPGEKIGIVGRTGAGKSSIISALFRLSYFEGSIFIDDQDTKNFNLKDLRRQISIIPQEPVLFSATLRYNLDPFNEFDDDRIWNVLDKVELKETIKCLDMLVSEDGSNFSLGQRQLLCLARALLRENKIFILDEATANIDFKTDSFIQKTIRESFRGCTVLTIAHRLDTILDSDRVLVMDHGKLVEFDEPQKLLENPTGYFSKLVQKSAKGVK